MKRYSLILLTGIMLAATPGRGRAQCPEDTSDHGACDTMYVELYPLDAMFTGAGHLVRVPVFITNDIIDPNIDSIAGMVIPLCYTHTNPAVYCSLPPYWNVSAPYTSVSRCVFRHLDDTTHNLFLDTYGPSSPGWYHDFIVDMSTAGQYFRLSWIPSMPSSPRWPGGSRQLAFIMTFRVEDTITVCVDTCVWPPMTYLRFVRSDAVSYTPRDNMPYCFTISAPDLGDANADGIVDIGDVVYLIGYLYRGGPPPTPPEVGDANCDGIVDIGDVVRLIGYLYKREPPPSC